MNELLLKTPVQCPSVPGCLCCHGAPEMLPPLIAMVPLNCYLPTLPWCPSNATCPHCHTSRRRGLRVFLFLLFTAAAAAGGIYGKRWYDEHKEKDKGKVAGKKEEPKRVEPKKDGKKRW